MGLSKNNDRMESIVTQTTTKPKTQYISEGHIQSFVLSYQSFNPKKKLNIITPINEAKYTSLLVNSYINLSIYFIIN